MIAGDIHHPRTVARQLQNAADHIIMRRWPIPALFQSPAVDDVTDKVERFAFNRMEEIKE